MQYIGPGESPVERLERKHRGLQAELENVKKDRDKNYADLRNEYAAVKSVLNNLRSEVQSLRGELERTAYSFETHVQAYETWRQRQESASPVLQQPVSDLPATAGPGSSASSGIEKNKTGEKSSDAARDAVMTEDELYATGIQLFEIADYGGARDTFGQFLQLYPESRRCDNAHFWIGETYYRENEYEKAILKYQEVIDQFPGGNKTPSALLKQGMAFNRINDDINARLVLKRLVSEFPDSREARDAVKLLQEM